MATFYLTYYGDIVDGTGTSAQVPRKRLGKDKLTISGATTRIITAIPSGTQIVVVKTDTACQYDYGASDVEADATSEFLAAGATYAFGPDSATHVAVIEQQT